MKDCNINILDIVLPKYKYDEIRTEGKRIIDIEQSLINRHAIMECFDYTQCINNAACSTCPIMRQKGLTHVRVTKRVFGYSMLFELAGIHPYADMFTVTLGKRLRHDTL